MKGSVHYKKFTRKYYPIIYFGQDELTRKKKYKWGSGHISARDADAELRYMLSKNDWDEISFGKAETFERIYDEWKKLIEPELCKSHLIRILVILHH